MIEIIRRDDNSLNFMEKGKPESIISVMSTRRPEALIGNEMETDDYNLKKWTERKILGRMVFEGSDAFERGERECVGHQEYVLPVHFFKIVTATG